MFTKIMVIKHRTISDTNNQISTDSVVRAGFIYCERTKKLMCSYVSRVPKKKIANLFACILSSGAGRSI